MAGGARTPASTADNKLSWRRRLCPGWSRGTACRCPSRLSLLPRAVEQAGAVRTGRRMGSSADAPAQRRQSLYPLTRCPIALSGSPKTGDVSSFFVSGLTDRGGQRQLTLKNTRRPGYCLFFQPSLPWESSPAQWLRGNLCLARGSQCDMEIYSWAFHMGIPDRVSCRKV